MTPITYPMPQEWPYASYENQNQPKDERGSLEKPEPKLDNGGLNYVW